MMPLSHWGKVHVNFTSIHAYIISAFDTRIEDAQVTCSSDSSSFEGVVQAKCHSILREEIQKLAEDLDTKPGPNAEKSFCGEVVHECVTFLADMKSNANLRSNLYGECPCKCSMKCNTNPTFTQTSCQSNKDYHQECTTNEISEEEIRHTTTKRNFCISVKKKKIQVLVIPLEKEVAVPNNRLFTVDINMSVAESETSGDSEANSEGVTHKTTLPTSELPVGNAEGEVDGEFSRNTASVMAIIEHSTSVQRLLSTHSHPVTEATTLLTTVYPDGSSSTTPRTTTPASDVPTSISSTYSLRIHRTRASVETSHYYDGYTDSTPTHPSQFQPRTSRVETTYYHDTKTHPTDGTTTFVEDIGRSTSPTYVSQIKTFTEPHNALEVTSAIVPEKTDFTSTYSSELQRGSSRVGTSYYYERKTHFSPSTSTVTEDIGRSTASTHETQIRTSTKPYNAPKVTLATVSNYAATNGSSSAPRTEDNDSGYTASEVTSAPATSYTRGRTKALFSSAKTIEEESGSAKVTYAPRTQQRTSPELASTAPFSATSSTHFLGTQPITSAQPHTTLEITSVTALSHSGRSINVLSGVTTAEKDVDSTSTRSQKTQSSAVENGSFTASNKNTALPSSTSSGRATEEKGISAKFTHDPRTQQGTSSKLTSSTFTYPERSARTYLDKSTWDVEDLSSATSSMHFLRTQSRISTLPFITPELTSVTVPSYSGGSTSVLPSTTTAGNDDDSTSTHSLKIQSPAGEYGGFTVSNKNTGLLSSSRRKSSEAPVSSTENMKDNWRTPSSTTHTLTTQRITTTLLHTYKEVPSKMDLNTHKTVTGESSSSNSYATDFEYPTSFFSIHSKRTTLPHSNPKDAPATHSSSSHTSNRGVATTTISGAVRSTTSSIHTPELQRTAESPNTKERTLLTTSPLFSETARGTSSKSDFSATPFSFMSSQGTIQSTKSSESSSSASISTTFTSTIPENTKLIYHSSTHDQVHENISDEETTTRVTGVPTTRKNIVTPLITLSAMTSANKKQVDELPLNTSATISTVETLESVLELSDASDRFTNGTEHPESKTTSYTLTQLLRR
ncbi:hypothetical protein RB195_016037 [Necator americanus]|uniref:Uncharacterized protein n=1 Tax=Necator americanus TaxID=51031 RepID=A0ABR1E796_NECAM